MSQRDVRIMDCLNNIWKTKTPPLCIRHSGKLKKNSTVRGFAAELGDNVKVWSSLVVVWFVEITRKQSDDEIIFIHLNILGSSGGDDSEGLNEVSMYHKNMDTYTNEENKKEWKPLSWEISKTLGGHFTFFFCS